MRISTPFLPGVHVSSTRERPDRHASRTTSNVSLIALTSGVLLAVAASRRGPDQVLRGAVSRVIRDQASTTSA
jgi:hypothetical protein